MKEAVAQKKQGWATAAVRTINLGMVASSLRGLPLVPTFILSVVLFFGVFGDIVVPYDPDVNDLKNVKAPPAGQAGGSVNHVLGTDHLGRDVLSRIISGARISLIVGVSAVFFAGSIGLTFALVSGYFGGWLDAVIMRLTDIVLSMPLIMVAMTLVGILGPGVRNIVLVLAIMGWAGYARILRSEVLRVREQDFIRLAIVGGCSWRRILLRHIAPNIINTLVVLATLQLGIIIIVEASLSFLGLGVPPPQPAWGSMLADGREYITTAWWLSAFPGLAIMFTVLGTNLLGEWLRIRLDPKFRQL